MHRKLSEDGQEHKNARENYLLTKGNKWFLDNLLITIENTTGLSTQKNSNVSTFKN